MAPRKTPDLADSIDRIMTRAAARIARAVARHQAKFTASLGRSLENLGLQAPTRARPRRRQARPGRIRTADVALQLKTLLQAAPEGLRIGELRQATGYSDMQLGRALARLEESGAITRSGGPRKTIYRPTGVKKRRKRR